ncbi:hypothetical protein ACE6H2_001942 [Prunus campanulata]
MIVPAILEPVDDGFTLRKRKRMMKKNISDFVPIRLELQMQLKRHNDLNPTRSCTLAVGFYAALWFCDANNVNCADLTVFICPMDRFCTHLSGIADAIEKREWIG